MDSVDNDKRALCGWTLYNYDDDLYSSSSAKKDEQRRRGHCHDQSRSRNDRDVFVTERSDGLPTQTPRHQYGRDRGLKKKSVDHRAQSAQAFLQPSPSKQASIESSTSNGSGRVIAHADPVSSLESYLASSSPIKAEHQIAHISLKRRSSQPDMTVVHAVTETGKASHRALIGTSARSSNAPVASVSSRLKHIGYTCVHDNRSPSRNHLLPKSTSPATHWWASKFIVPSSSAPELQAGFSCVADTRLIADDARLLPAEMDSKKPLPQHSGIVRVDTDEHHCTRTQRSQRLCRNDRVVRLPRLGNLTRSSSLPVYSTRARGSSEEALHADRPSEGHTQS
jgi:hypothetical protein